LPPLVTHERGLVLLEIAFPVQPKSEKQELPTTAPVLTIRGSMGKVLASWSCSCCSCCCLFFNPGTKRGSWRSCKIWYSQGFTEAHCGNGFIAGGWLFWEKGNAANGSESGEDEIESVLMIRWIPAGILKVKGTWILPERRDFKLIQRESNNFQEPPLLMIQDNGSVLANKTFSWQSKET